MFYCLLMYNCYIILHINSQMLSLIVNQAHDFSKHTYIHTIDRFYIQTVSLAL